jgi:hypothetical protein
MAPSQQHDVLQTMQGGLPVIHTAYEAGGLRVSSEAWLLPAEDGDWAAMQVVLFNIADVVLRGTFSFALRPYNPEGISPIYNIACDGHSLKADGRPPVITWPEPEGWALSGLRTGDLFTNADCGLRIADLTTDDGRRTTNEEAALSVNSTIHNPQSAILNDPHGFAHGVLQYSFNIEPWEEAEFLAFTPIHIPRKRRVAHHKPIFGSIKKEPQRAEDNRQRLIANQTPTPGMRHQAPQLSPQTSVLSPQHYSRAKAATTLQWRALLDSGMKVTLPHRDLQASWEANRAHVLALHDGDVITPGPDIYHNFWFRDAVYMAHSLSMCGYVEAAEQLLRSFVKRQRREGLMVSHSGEWDSTGQVLWAIGQHFSLHPNNTLLAEFAPAIERGAAWMARTLEKSPDGLMPPGISSEHFGPPDRYYWDNLWSLAGLETTQALLSEVRGRKDKGYARAIEDLKHSLNVAWDKDVAALGRDAIPAAPGRGIDLGAVGTLAAWFPLQLFPPDDPRLEGTLAALEEATFYEGALFVNTGHSGWSSYLNMRIAGCRLLQGSPKGWEMMRWLLRHASPTYNWPEAIHPRSGGGSAGDGHHGWASAEWLMLVRALLFQESRDTLTITPALPVEWLDIAGEIIVKDAPTIFGPLSFKVEWDNGGRTLQLELDAEWRTPPSSITWRAPGTSVTLAPNKKGAVLTRPT